LNSNSVRYLLIGAHALAYHGLPRFTEDLDVWIGRDSANAENLERALEMFGTPFPAGGKEAFLERQRMVRLGVPPNRIDILNFGPNMPFDEAWARRELTEIDSVPVPVLCREDFIRSKRDSGRTKDLRDLEELGEETI
jgi:hypothetical protein